MKKESYTKNSIGTVNLRQKVLCACNARACEGECRETHLQNSRTGVCVAAYNPPKTRFQRIEKDKDREFSNFLDW